MFILEGGGVRVDPWFKGYTSTIHTKFQTSNLVIQHFGIFSCRCDVSIRDGSKYRDR